MKTESTLYFDGQFWVGVIERHEADRVRAVRIVFGAQPSDAELYEFLLAHANALLCRLDEAAWASDIGQHQATHHNPKRAHSAKRPISLAARFLPLRRRQRFKQNENARRKNELPQPGRRNKRKLKRNANSPA